MTNDDLSSLRLLEIRNAIVDKEIYIANMNREQALGHWLSDWNRLVQEANSRIDQLTEQLKRGE